MVQLVQSNKNLGFSTESSIFSAKNNPHGRSPPWLLVATGRRIGRRSTLAYTLHRMRWSQSQEPQMSCLRISDYLRTSEDICWYLRGKCDNVQHHPLELCRCAALGWYIWYYSWTESWDLGNPETGLAKTWNNHPKILELLSEQSNIIRFKIFKLSAIGIIPR